MTTPTPTPTLDLKNIQGDILGGFPKKTEVYVFFKIINVARFKADLAQFAPLVKTTAQVVKDRELIKEHKKKHPRGGPLLPLVGVNISFSVFGLQKLGITTEDIDKLGDESFKKGQLKDAFSLKDPGAGPEETFDPAWDPAFKTPLDGLFLIAGDSHATVSSKLDEVKHIFGLSHGHGHNHRGDASVEKIKTIWGDVRPGKESAHEHFGFLDGISNPTIIGFDKNPPANPHAIQPGNIIAKQPGDGKDAAVPRPAWAADGSFLVFRHLFQLVPEFNDFLDQHPVVAPGLSKKDGSDLRGARMVGRWKSGTPIDLSPLHDDLDIANDPTRINNFRFENERNDQTRCPFAAHVRKTFPRDDLLFVGPNAIDNRRIMRRGIQFGPEVTIQEKYERSTQHSRGLLFVCYQSSIDNGFHFMQTSWANNPTFPPEQTPVVPGIDGIIGQAGNNGPRTMSGTNPNNTDEEITFNSQFVVPRGGEYFFAPSIKTLKTVLAV